MMRYALLVSLVLVLAAALPNSSVYATDQVIKVSVDGKTRSFDPPAMVRDAKAYVPLRQVSEVLGCTVKYEASSRTIKLTYCGKPTIIKQSEGLTIDGSMFVPLRKVGEAFGCKVAYDGAAALVRITKPVVSTGSG
jgi:hypothetical protein